MTVAPTEKANKAISNDNTNNSVENSNKKSTKLTDIEKEKKLAKELNDLRRKRRQKEKEKQQNKLAEIGAVCEKVLGREFQEADVDKLRVFLEQQESRGKFYSSAMNG